MEFFGTFFLLQQCVSFPHLPLPESLVAKMGANRGPSSRMTSPLALYNWYSSAVHLSLIFPSSNALTSKGSSRYILERFRSGGMLPLEDEEPPAVDVVVMFGVGEV